MIDFVDEVLMLHAILQYRMTLTASLFIRP